MTFQKLDLLPSSGDRGRETPTLLGPLDRANREGVSLPLSPEDGSRSSFRNVMLSSYFRFPDDGQSPETH
jgi:hypothetical protein